MPDGKDKKYVSDPSLLSQLNDAPAVSAPSEKKYVSDPALVEALESAPASQESVVPQSGSEVIQTEQGEVSIRPGVSPEKVRKDRSLHAKLNNIPTENVAKDLSFATDVVNKLYGKQFTEPKEAVTIEKVGTTQSGIPASTERTYTTDGTVTETSTVGITPEMVANKDAAVQSIRNEISAAPDYLKRDVEATMANLPDWAKDGFGSVGIDIESKVQEMVDPKGRPGALKEYMQARLPFLESSRQKEIQELDKIYPVQRQTYRVGDNIRERITRENEAEYNAQLDQINEKYGEEKEALSNSAFMLASQKVVSQLMRSNKDLVNVNPYQVGAEVERILGDEEVVNRDERLWRKYSDTDPTTKVNREIQGYQALEAAKYAAIAEGDEVTAKRLAEITDNYPEKVREDNPQFVKHQKVAALRNQIAKDNDTFWDSFA